jgi:hypothetical protein
VLLSGLARASLIPRLAPNGDLYTIASQMTVLPRSAWDSQPADTTRLHRCDGYTRATIHHAGNRVVRDASLATVASGLNNIRDAHLEQRYGDIGYHLIVDYAGRVWEGRALAYEGAHVLNENAGNFGVMLLGNFERQSPSLPQLVSMQGLVQALQLRYGIPNSRIYGHRDLGASVCPGRNLYPYVSELRHRS